MLKHAPIIKNKLYLCIKISKEFVLYFKTN